MSDAIKYGELTLDQIEQLCNAAISGPDAFEYEGQGANWYNGGWSLDSPSPKDVLALVARIRELEAALIDERREALALARRAFGE